ncbi:MAG: 50S ribosomal protein L22 [Patescibacteria group bacterium]|jgi:large subunit ribosomal protein L22
MEKVTKKIEDKTAKPSQPVKVQPKSDKEKTKEVTEIKASANYLRLSAKKTRLVIERVKGLEAEKALDYLRFVNKGSVLPITKLIKSAIANAENNFTLDKKDLYVKSFVANTGPVLKRWRPRAHGRAGAIRKQTAHLELILGVRPGAKKGKITKSESKEEEVKVVKPNEVKKEALKNNSRKGPDGQNKDQKGFMKGMFQRKTG